MWPHLLPGGHGRCSSPCCPSGTIDDGIIAVRDLQTGTQKTLVRGGAFPLFARSGHLVYATAGTLRAIRFDPATLAVSGQSAAGSGSRGQQRHRRRGRERVERWRDGLHLGCAGHPRFNVPRPPGTRRAAQPAAAYVPHAAVVARRLSESRVDIRDQENDIWIWDLSRRTLTRLTTGPFIDQSPVWTPDGRRIAFSSTRLGAANLYWQATDGTGTAEQLTTARNTQTPLAFTPDGKSLIFRELDGASGFSMLNVLPLEGDRTAEAAESHRRSAP